VQGRGCLNGDKTTTERTTGQANRPGPRRRSTTPFGRTLWSVVKGKPKAVDKALTLLARDGGDGAQTLVRQLVEAMTERELATGDLRPAPLRSVNDPSARGILALYLALAERTGRNGFVNARGLWQGHKQAGKGGGLAGRLGGVCAETVRRWTACLEASGIFTAWQPKPGAPGIACSRTSLAQGLYEGKGQAFNVYVLHHVPQAVKRRLREWYDKLSQRSPFPPEAPSRPQAPAARPAPQGAQGAAPLPTSRAPPPLDAAALARGVALLGKLGIAIEA